ncbi:MAG: hypothetical protein ACD_75C02317G0001, partial [uncultured bacterium]
MTGAGCNEVEMVIMPKGHKYRLSSFRTALKPFRFPDRRQ